MRIDEYLLMQREIVLHFILRQQTGLSRLGNEFPPAPSAFSRFSPFAFRLSKASTIHRTAPSNSGTCHAGSIHTVSLAVFLCIIGYYIALWNWTNNLNVRLVSAWKNAREERTHLTLTNYTNEVTNVGDVGYDVSKRAILDNFKLVTNSVKGDGVHPECTSCLRSNRSCQWPTDSSDAASNQTNRANNDAASQLRPIPELISTSDPELALRDPRVFYLFRHYKDNLASWYDLNDHHRHFTDIVPVKARYSPLLLSAILAFSAISLLSSSISGPWADQANFYLLESVEILLEVTRNIEAAVSDGEVLAAICLLRSYEIISENLGSQSHLRGYYSILASTSINLDSLSSLARASFWNFLRENITVALIERQKLMVELPDELVPKDLDSDDDYANAITILLGQVINQCFGEDTSSVDRLLYLENRLEVWKASIPHSFTPIVNHDSVGHYQRPFPFMGTLHGWHAASIQYYQTAMIILALARPKFQTNKTTDNMRYVTELTRNLENRSSEICALALSSESQAVWVNSFGPIAFCGSWLRDVRKLRVTIRGVEHWGSRTGWPTSKIIKCLRETSADDGSH